MRRFIVDRIEDGKAVLEAENGEHLEIDKSQIPEEALEGDVLKEDGDALTTAPVETEERRDIMRNLLKGLIGDKNK